MSLVGVHVQGINVLAWRCWGDGIDIVSSQDVVRHRSLLRLSSAAAAPTDATP